MRLERTAIGKLAYGVREDQASKGLLLADYHFF